MNTAYLLTGGNMGNREQNLTLAAQKIEQSCGQIVQRSPVYETAAWGHTQQPAFLNQVLMISTPLSPEQLMHTLLDIEHQMGRIRQEKMGPRIIDLDILLINDEIIDTPFLRVPHPALPQRRFVLTPLADIAPEYKHPVLQQTIAELLENCSDTLDVQKK